MNENLVPRGNLLGDGPHSRTWCDPWQAMQRENEILRNKASKFRFDMVDPKGGWAYE